MTHFFPLCHFDYEISNDKLYDDIQHLVIESLPTWKSSKLKIEKLSGGLINTMVKCWRSEKPQESLIIRVYSIGGSILHCREREIKYCQALSERGCFPVLVATFKNGYCYRTYEGNVIYDNLDLLNDESYLSAVTKGFVMIHTIEIPGATKKSTYFELARHFVSNSIEEHMAMIQTYIPYLTTEVMLQELDIMEEEIKKVDSPIVLCHLDGHIRNILWNRKDDNVTFVDIELAKHDYQALDLAFHFVSFYWVEIVDDFKKLPISIEKYRKIFVHHYLRHWYEAKGMNPDDVQELDEEILLVTIKKFMLLVNLYMACVWANFKHSFEKFDPIRFAAERFKDYERMKSKYLNLEIPQKTSCK